MRMPLLAGMLGVVVAATLPIGVAQASTSTTGLIKVLSAGSPKSDPGLLSVNIESTTPVVPSSISVQLITQGTCPTHDATVNDFTLTAGHNTGGTTTTWTVPSALTQADLALGSYTIEVQAADTGGDTTSNSNAGTLSFIVYPTLTLSSVSPTSFSYGQTVTLSGTETGVYPDGTIQPVPGQFVETPGGFTTTNSAGQFSATVTAGVGNAIGMGQGNKVYVDVSASCIAPPFLYSNSVSVSVIPIQVQFSGVTIKPSPVSFGGGFSISATASYPIGATSLPLADTEIGVSAFGTEDSADFGYLPVSDTTTDINGSFTTVIDGPVSTTNYAFALTGMFSGTSWFKIPRTLKVPVIHHPMRFSYFTPLPRRGGRILFRGCVNVVSPWTGPEQNMQLIDPSELAPFPKAKFQYAAGEDGPWHAARGAGAVAPFRPARQPFTRRCYVTTTRRPAHSAWFRFVVPTDTAWNGLQSAPAKPEKQIMARVFQHR